MMKRAITICMIFITLLTLTACDNKSEQSDNASKAQVSTNEKGNGTVTNIMYP